MECLAELGWAGTSTTEVARRAGVSRGAQQHHYRTKLELVTAAVDHLLDRHRIEYQRSFAALPPGQRNGEGAVDLLWQIFRGPTFTALIELVMAARTDESLRPVAAEAADRVATVTIETYHEVFPAAGESAEVMHTVLRGMLSLMTGLALQNALDDDRYGHQAEILSYLKTLARQLVPDDATGRNSEEPPWP